MTWTRLDDAWTERADLGRLSHADRWHYLAMIQRCSRNGLRDGVMRGVDARRCSDHPDPDLALRGLVHVGLVDYDMRTDTFKVLEVEAHLPTESVLRRSAESKDRMRRSRAHKAGDHRLCDEHCDAVRANVHVNVGTGRDGTGRPLSVSGSDRREGKEREHFANADATSRWRAQPLPGHEATS